MIGGYYGEEPRCPALRGGVSNLPVVEFNVNRHKSYTYNLLKTREQRILSNYSISNNGSSGLKLSTLRSK